MIYFSGVDSFIESAYLGEDIGDNMRLCNIFVNPLNITYLAGKTVIVTLTSYPQSNINLLLRHGNKVVSRLLLKDMEGVIYNPYIIRPEERIMWSGEVIGKEIDSIDQLSEDCIYSIPKKLLLFPKIKNTKIELKDEKGNLSCLGWALHQVGINVEINSPFLDLEVLKTKKIQL